MNRSTLLRTAGAAAASVSLSGPLGAASAEPKKILIAEPQHNLGNLPLYVAVDRGFFDNIAVSIITLPATGSAPTDAVMTGRAWGFLGGTEHNAYTNSHGASLRAVIAIGSRGNQYFVARKGLTPGNDLKAFFKGKTVATGPYGSAPNNITRYVIAKLGLDLTKDLQVLEVENSAIPIVMTQKKADIAGVREPLLTKGVTDGIWDEPFYNVPKRIGPFSFSALSVPYAAIADDAATTKAVVNGMRKAFAYMRDHFDGTALVAKKEFPDQSDALIKASLRRSYDDQMWGDWTGFITPAAFKVGTDVAKTAGLLKDDIAYSQCIDMRYIPRKSV